jgi:hypothetical protein
MVVIDVHKAAALATKSLSTMLGQMPKGLQGHVEGPAGQQGQHQRLQQVREVPRRPGRADGVAVPRALQELDGLLEPAEGRQGHAITTTTTQYQKMLGGMTGAAVAMQIAGKYAKENARNVREVGKAALEAGSDVLGWNKTQDTLSAKMDRAKASLQVLAVEIGTALIPASRRSSTRSAAPSNGSPTSITTAGRVGTAMRGIGAALGGAAIGAAVGTLTANSSTAVKAIGVLGSAAAGAAIGFGAGGPLGAAIGGIAGRSDGARHPVLRRRPCSEGCGRSHGRLHERDPRRQ